MRRQASADFYQRAFGWTIRTRGDGAIAFDDTTGEVSGAFVKGRPPAAAPGFMIYIMVDSVADAIEKVKANGGLRSFRLGVLRELRVSLPLHRNSTAAACA